MVSCGDDKLKGILAGLIIFLSLVLSSTAFSAGSPFAGVYIGTSSGPGCDNGQFFALVQDDGTFNLLVHVDLGVDEFLTNFVKEGLVIAGDGSFFTSAAIMDGEDVLNVMVMGTFTPQAVSGTFSDDTGCSGMFSGSRVSDSGPLANTAGYYTGNATGALTLDGAPLGTFTGTVSTILAADGSGLMVHDVQITIPGQPIDPLTIGGPINVDSNGNFSEVLDGVTVNGSIDTSTFTGNGTTSATFVEPEGVEEESGTFTLARQLPLPSPITNDVVANLPSGVTIFFNDNTSSNVLHPDTATAIAVADVDGNGEDDVIASFAAGSGPGATGGTFISRNGAALVLLDPNIADEIVSGNFDGAFGDDLMLNSGAAGLSLVLNDTGIIPFIPVPTSAIAAGDVDNTGLDDLIFAIAGFGTVVLKDFSTVDILDPGAADELAVADVDNNGEQDVIAGFTTGTGPGGTGGTFISKNQGAFTLLDTKTAEEIAVGDFDDNGPDDLLIDFGADNLWLSLDGTPPFLFIDLPVSAVGSGDMDSNGQSDMLFSFTGIGTFVLKNLATFEVLDPGVAIDLATGTIPEATPPAAGSIIISELMVNPSVSLDIDGEWIELANTTGSAININGWTLTDESANTHTINNGGPLSIPVGGFLVLGVNADPLANGGVTLDYQYSDLTLNNGGDTITLMSPGPSGIVVDSVVYGPGFAVSGQSTSLDEFSNWCSSTMVFGDGDTGTPGAVNELCP